MEGSMSQATTLNAPEEQITALMKQVADENGLEIASALPSVDTSIGTASRQQEELLTKRYPLFPPLFPIIPHLFHFVF